MFDIAAVPYHAPIQEGGFYNTIVIGFPLTLLKKRANTLQESYAFEKFHQCVIRSSLDYL